MYKIHDMNKKNFILPFPFVNITALQFTHYIRLKKQSCLNEELAECVGNCIKKVIIHIINHIIRKFLKEKEIIS